MRIAFLTPLHRRGPWQTPENGHGSWALAAGAEFFPYDAADLGPLEACDPLLLHVSMGLYEAATRVLDRFPRKAAVLMLTCDAMFIDPQGFFPGWRTPLKALLDRARLAVTETEEVGFFQAMTATPVVHLPLPLPLAAMRAAKKSCEFRVASCGLGGGDGGPLVLLGAGFRPKKNGIASAMAFRRLRSAEPAARAVVFADEPDAEREAYAAWDVQGVEVRPSTCDQPLYWRAAAACDLALHLDYRRTIGRFSADCAALGVPCISTDGATMQRALFPDLIVGPWDVEGAVALALRLLRSPVFRDRVVEKAASAVEALDLKPMGRRFRELLRRYGMGEPTRTPITEHR